MLRYENIEMLYLLALIPILIMIFMVSLNWRKKALNKLGDYKLVLRLIPMASRFKYRLKFILLIISLTALIIGLANPQIGSKMEEVNRKGIDLMIAIDLSNSMLAEDLQPNRLLRAKQSISKLIDRLEGDRIGLVVFAGDAYVQLPITTDYSAAKLFLSTINTDIVPTQGTAIGKAISLCIKSFDYSNNQSKAIILITDGENHEDNATEKAQEAKELDILVHTIGMGSEQGGPIPIKKRNGQISYQKDNDGNTIVTRINEDMLKKIAQAGGGSYIRAQSTQTGLDKLFKEISKMEKSNIETKVFKDYKDQFQWFIGISILFLIIRFFMSERKSEWSNNINLFEENEK